jgi:branched-chain amino acid transport system permease protein
MDARRYIPIGILAGVIVLLQLITLLLDVQYYLTQLTMSAYYSLVAIGLCMLMGYAGQISLGQAGFFAIGGYTTAKLTTINLLELQGGPLVGFLTKTGLTVESTDIYGNQLLSLSPWISFLIAIAVTFGIAVVIGIPVLKLKGHYLAMATLGFGVIIYRIVLGTPAFGEADGITNIPQFHLLPGLAVSGDFDTRIENYYIAWILVIIGMILLVNLIHSRTGRALRGIHGSEEAAAAMGVNVSSYKLRIFILSALFASIAGVFLTHYNSGIGPSESGVMKSVRYVAIVAVGGMANVWGTLIMGTLLNFLSLRGVFGSYDDAVFGLILILIMVFAPNGVLNREMLSAVWENVRSFFLKEPIGEKQ